MCFKEADILLPKGYDNPDFMEKWAIIACDQYTSDIDYWNKVKSFSGEAMSALNLIFPEIYLECESEDLQMKRINNISENMKNYSYSDDFICFENAMFFIERTLRNGAKRFGIVGAVDLEEYSYEKDSQLKIRSTEETVISRIPPRVKIRENADLELPHVMILYNDANDVLTDNLINNLKSRELKKIYDFKLMQNSGEIKAYLLDKKNIDFVKNTLGGFENQDLLFAVGDGNHSLAAAKQCYENLKKNTQDYLNHPSRYALAEIVNIYDKSLEFEPIYRILFDVDPHDVIKKMPRNLNCEIYYDGNSEKISSDMPEHNLSVKTLQIFLDDYLKNHGGRIDYIHGRNEVISLAGQSNAIGFICGTVQKSGLFKAIAENGVLPRKTFSMGEAYDKRFYVECRKIK